MGASNFGRPNASKIFAVLMNYEEASATCEVCGETYYDNEQTKCCGVVLDYETEYKSPDEWMVDDLKALVREQVQTAASSTTYDFSEQDYSDHNRNYPSTTLFHLDVSKNYSDTEVFFRLSGFMMAGYHEGAMLDWRLEVYFPNCGCEEIKGVDDLDFMELFDASDNNNGIKKILSTRAEKWAAQEVDKMIQLVEKVYQDISMPLETVGTFSNGETIYRKVEQ